MLEFSKKLKDVEKGVLPDHGFPEIRILSG